MTQSLCNHYYWSSRVGTTSEMEAFYDDVQAMEGIITSILQTDLCLSIPSADTLHIISTFSGLFPGGLGLHMPNFLTTWQRNRGVSWCHFQVDVIWWPRHRRASPWRGPRNRWSFLVMTSHEEARSL